MVPLPHRLKSHADGSAPPREPIAGRTIAIGDIHGCARALEVLLELIKPTPDDLIVTLGDYVDRGPESQKVIDRLINLQQECQLVPLLGNHEFMLLEAMNETLLFNFWMQCGGKETLASYGGTIDQIPSEHLDFIRSCQRYCETESYLFFHANYDPQVPAEQQSDQLLLWEHLGGNQPGPHNSGKCVLVGHTPQPHGQVLNLEHVICLDTYCFGDGCLTAMEVPAQKIWQVNKRGIICHWETTGIL